MFKVRCGGSNVAPARSSIRFATRKTPHIPCSTRKVSGSLLAGRRYTPSHPALKFGARQHDLTVAAQATNADVRPNAHDTPAISATRMHLPHLDDIANGKRHWSGHKCPLDLAPRRHGDTEIVSSILLLFSVPPFPRFDRFLLPVGFPPVPELFKSGGAHLFEGLACGQPLNCGKASGKLAIGAAKWGLAVVP